MRPIMPRLLPLLSVSLLGIALSTEPAAAQPEPCAAWEVEYALSANLTIRDTKMGAGDGTHVIGPGSVTLRFEGPVGPGPVKMLSYQMTERFTVNATAMFWKTSVTTDAQSAATPDGCGVVAAGKLERPTLAWSTPMRGYHTDGTLTCEGSMCGKFGAPPPGKSDLHEPARPVQLASFEFAPDLKTFTMAATQVSKSESPSQTTYIGLAGREVKRTCVVPKACPAP
jgi:hypothetical protein